MDFRDSDITIDMRTCLGLARDVAPFKTGNLRFNAMYCSRIVDGFLITYSLGSAYYIYFLEEGTKKSVKWQGFIANRTVPLIAEYLYSKYITENEAEVADFSKQADYGNLDFYQKHKTHFKTSFFGEKTPQEMLEQRDIKRFDSELANVLGKGKMSTAYDWQHNPEYEIEIPDKFKKQ